MKQKDIRTFYDILKVFEERSTCARLQVAAVLVKDGRVVSSGWNGVPSGQLECMNIFDEGMTQLAEFSERHAKFSNINELHAETNCIGYAARNGQSTEGTSIFVSISPCINCAKLIIASGIKEVYYITLYDRETLGIDLLKACGILVEQINV